MRTIRTKVYKFNELSQTAKDKAIEKLHDINTDWSWWDFVYEDFTTFCSEVGIEVDKINFALSYSQGDGSAFRADIDLPKLIKAIKNQSWKNNYPNETIEFDTVTPNIERIVKLINSGKIDGKAWIEQSNRGTDSKLVNEYGFIQSGLCITPVRVQSELDNLIELLEDVTKTLNKWLFKNLQNDLEYRCGKEAIIETIEANEYEFYQDGTLYNGK